MNSNTNLPQKLEIQAKRERKSNRDQSTNH